jgi:hypothetical protein
MKGRAVVFDPPAEVKTSGDLRRLPPEALITPWPLVFSRALLRSLWTGTRMQPGFRNFVNGPRPAERRAARGWELFRERLDLIADPHVPHDVALMDRAIEAPLWLVPEHGRVYFTVRAVRRVEGVHEHMRAWMFALLLLGEPSLRRLMRRCAFCERFELLSRNKAGDRHFCGRGCRAQWERSPAGLDDARERQRAYRKGNPGR